MKALSIRQPWAWLIVNGHKDIENRVWPTQVRGPILIHAGKGMTQTEYEEACAFIDSKSSLRHLNAILPAPADLDRGGIVGQAEITGCFKNHPSPWFVGEYGFLLRNARPLPLPFRPFTGMLGFFEVPDQPDQPEPLGEDIQPNLI